MLKATVFIGYRLASDKYFFEGNERCSIKVLIDGVHSFKSLN
jgi:hypothetical protein